MESHGSNRTRTPLLAIISPLQPLPGRTSRVTIDPEFQSCLSNAAHGEPRNPLRLLQAPPKSPRLTESATSCPTTAEPTNKPNPRGTISAPSFKMFRRVPSNQKQRTDRIHPGKRWGSHHSMLQNVAGCCTPPQKTAEQTHFTCGARLQPHRVASLQEPGQLISTPSYCHANPISNQTHLVRPAVRVGWGQRRLTPASASPAPTTVNL